MGGQRRDDGPITHLGPGASSARRSRLWPGSSSAHCEARPLRRQLKIVPARRFRFAVPLTVTAVDLDTGAQVLFGRAHARPAVDVLCASCALPMYYPPLVLGGRPSDADSAL